MAKTKKASPPPADDEVFQLRVALGAPPHQVWRRFQLSTRTRLSELHDVLQVVMGWTNSHRHDFDIDGKTYGEPSDDLGMKVYDEAKPSLASRLEVGDVFFYEYDFGDGWEHEIAVEAKLPRARGQAYPICIAGRLACPPENCGGLYGYVDIVDDIRDPTADADPDEEERYADYDPDAFSIDAVNRRLHGKETAAPRDTTIDPSLDALASALVPAVHAWWLAPEEIERSVLLEWEALASSLCERLADRPDAEAQFAALVEHCSGRLALWMRSLSSALARVGELDRGLAILAAMKFLPAKLVDAMRIDVYVAADRPAEARAAIDAALAAHGRDVDTLLDALVALEALKDWTRAEPIAREVMSSGEADVDDRAMAAGILTEVLRQLGRAEEADQLEASFGEDLDDDDVDGDDFDGDDFGADLDGDDGADDLDGDDGAGPEGGR